MLCVFSAYYVEYEKEYLTFINLQYGALLKRTFEQFCKKKNSRATILQWINTEVSNFQVKFHSRVAFNNL